MTQEKLAPFMPHRHHDVFTADGIYFCEDCKLQLEPPPWYYWKAQAYREAAYALRMQKDPCGAPLPGMSVEDWLKKTADEWDPPLPPPKVW